MRGVSIRIKLTLAFTLAMGLVLTATGAFLYLRFRSQLDHTIDRGLLSQTYSVQALVLQADGGLRQAGTGLSRNGDSFAQVIVEGRVRDWTTPLKRRPLLAADQLRRALSTVITVDRTSPPGIHGPARVLARTITGQEGQPTTILVGTLLSARNATLANLLALLLVGGAAALLLASAVGYLLATITLRKVDSMRRRAQSISIAAPGERLPEPRARDELWRLATTLNAMLARNEAAFARERAFVADASHELRTPLTILRAELEIALRHSGSRSHLEAAARSATEEANRLSGMIDDLLVLARADSRQLALHRERLDVGVLLSWLVRRFEAHAGDSSRSLTAITEPQLALYGDRARLEQALSNMLDNALRHGRGSVVLRARDTGDAVELRVCDEGRGFPPGFLSRAFERFATADSTRPAIGSGLGLSIVRSIAHAHGGDAHARNRPEGGAEVWIVLPRNQGSAAPCPGRPHDLADAKMST